MVSIHDQHLARNVQTLHPAPYKGLAPPTQHVWRAGIFLMGYGLVAVPRQLWRTADLKGEERALCHRAGAQAEKALAARRYSSKCTPAPLLGRCCLTPLLLLS